MARMPKRVLHRKIQRGRIKGNATRGQMVSFGDFGLQTVEGGWISAATIEAGRIAAQQYLRTEGKLYVRIFPDKSMLDGNDVRITVRSDIGNLSLSSNLLDDTLLNGWLPTTKMNFHTPFAPLAALAYTAFGIDPYEECSVLID